MRKSLIDKRKKGRRPSGEAMVHTAFLLPQGLLNRLRRDAAHLKHGLSTEIRQRLQLTYDRQELPKDLETDSVLNLIKDLTTNLAGDVGKQWHEHPYAWAAFKAGVEMFLVQYRPDGDQKVRPDTRLVGEPDDAPEVVGRTHARLLWIASGAAVTNDNDNSGPKQPKSRSSERKLANRRKL